MRACARVALVLMAVSASFGLAGCGLIDDLKDAVSRWFDIGKTPGGPGVFANKLPDAPPMIPPEKPSRKEASKASKKKDSQLAKGNGRRPLRRNYRPPTPPRRQSRKAPSRNPRRLSLRRRYCAPSGPKHRQPVFFHAKIGHRNTGLPREQ